MNLKEEKVKRVEEGRDRHGECEYLGKLGFEYIDFIEEKND